MSGTISRNQGHFFSENQFESLKQNENHHYDQRLMGQQKSFSPECLVQPYHQTSFSSIGEYPTIYYNQLVQHGLNPELSIHSNRLDKQYQHQQNWNYWKHQGNMTALSMHARLFPMNYTNGAIYPFEKEAQFMEHPGFDAQRALNYGRPSNLVYPGWLNSNVANFDDVRCLPPKMRAVFVPSGFLPVQQSCTGPLAMPPFTFNRMSQPLCSLPLPPPLPQIASLYLDDNIQQMLMQRYVTPNWQISQPTISACPQVLQQQQQQSIIPTSTSHSYQPALNSGNMRIFPLQTPLSPTDINPTSQIPQYLNSGHPHTYSTCIPAPTSLNNALNINSRIQFSPTYDHTPAAIANTNMRSADERSVPLLRPSATLKDVHNQTRQQYEYSHMNAWSHKTPPLPPGAKIIFDEYITKNYSFQKQRNSKQHQKQPQPINKTFETSTPTKINNINEDESSKNQPLNNVTKVDNDTTNYQSLVKSRSVTSACSVHNLSFNQNVKNEEMIISSNNRNQNINHEQLPAETLDMELHSDDQPRKLFAVHDIDRQLNPNDENLNSSSNADALRDLRLSLAVGDDLLSSVPDSPTNEKAQSDKKTNKSMHASSSTPPLLKRSEIESSTIHETIRISPPIIKTRSHDSLSSTKSRSFDSISITTLSRTDKQSVQNFSNTETL